VVDLKKMNYCLKCGNPLSDGLHFGQMRRMCDTCGFIHFRDPKVAAVVAVTDGDHLLLVKRGSSPELGKWSMPGGYIDYGEDPREAAIREVREESGLDVRVTQLIDVLGGEGFGGADIVIMFEAEVIGGTLGAEDDAEEAVFFSASMIPMTEIAAFTSTRMMLDRWLLKNQQP
jgi:8-oxo-dGTP diphosphatase